MNEYTFISFPHSRMLRQQERRITLLSYAAMIVAPLIIILTESLI